MLWMHSPTLFGGPEDETSDDTVPLSCPLMKLCWWKQKERSFFLGSEASIKVYLKLLLTGELFLCL
jgi:hypothetical protein